MKNRSFMLGLGLGLVLGALLLQLMLAGQRQGQIADLELTQDQLQQAAEKLNLQVIDASEQLMTEAEWQEQVEKAEDEQEEKTGLSGLDEQEAEKPEQPTEPAAPSEPADKSTTATTPSNPPKEPVTAKTPATTIQIYIKNGSNLTDVARTLESAGVISNQEQFIKKATARKANTKIQYGSYDFKAGEDMDAIITKITTKGAH